MNAKVKITVLKRLHNQDLIEEYCDSNWNACDRYTEGEEFVVTGEDIPEGFCGWAWADLHKYIITLARGGNFSGVKPGVFVTCCTDGFRPVIFKLERV